MLSLTRRIGQGVRIKSAHLDLVINVVSMNEWAAEATIAIDAPAKTEAMIKDDNGAS